MERLAGGLLLAVEDRANGVGNRLGKTHAGVLEIGRLGQGRIVQLDGPGGAGGAIHVEGDAVWLGSQQAPAHEHLALTLIDGDHATAEFLHLALRAG